MHRLMKKSCILGHPIAHTYNYHNFIFLLLGSDRLHGLDHSTDTSHTLHHSTLAVQDLNNILSSSRLGQYIDNNVAWRNQTNQSSLWYNVSH